MLPRSHLQVIESMRPADILLSTYHGRGVAKLIAAFQGRGGAYGMPAPSHGCFYYGRGHVIESTFPRGRVASVHRFFTEPYTTLVFRPPWPDHVRNSVLRAMESVALTPYDTEKLALHLVDNLFERLTWNRETQRGWRPLSRWIPDQDRDRRNICTEAMGRSWFKATATPLSSYVVPGQERPLDWLIWCRHHANFLWASNRGKLTDDKQFVAMAMHRFQEEVA